jgi:hypothetical protein
MTLHPIPSEFPYTIYMYKENFVLFFISALASTPMAICYWCQQHQQQISYRCQLPQLKFVTGINHISVKFATGTVGVVDTSV